MLFFKLYDLIKHEMFLGWYYLYF